MSTNKDISGHMMCLSHVHFVSDTRTICRGNLGMSTSKDISGHKMCPLGVKLIFPIRKFHFSSSVLYGSSIVRVLKVSISDSTIAKFLVPHSIETIVCLGHYYWCKWQLQNQPHDRLPPAEYRADCKYQGIDEGQVCRPF